VEVLMLAFMLKVILQPLILSRQAGSRLLPNVSASVAGMGRLPVVLKPVPLK